MSLIDIAIVLHYCVVTYVLYRIMIRPYRENASRLAWSILVIVLPVFGFVLYFMFGETSIGFLREKRAKKLKKSLFKNDVNHAKNFKSFEFVPKEFEHIFKLGYSVNKFMPTDINNCKLMNDTRGSIESIINDINQAKSYIFVLFYIWLDDNNGKSVAQALINASQRGVECRVIVDAVGSRKFIGTSVWQDMLDSGIKTATSLSIDNILLRAMLSRIDLRNHRKIVVIDDSICYCGSQNCADEAFLPKAKYAPWVDVMVRLEGDIALQNRLIFLQD